MGVVDALKTLRQIEPRKGGLVAGEAKMREHRGTIAVAQGITARARR